MICIYCKALIDNSSNSRSDIIPDFLGDGLILDNCVCKTCNNEFNSQVEQTLKNKFHFIRSGLNLKGRRGKPLKVIGKIEINSLNKVMNVDVDSIRDGIPPFKHEGPDGNEYYVVIGNNGYLEAKKAEISKKKNNLDWKEIDKSNIDFVVKILPTDVMLGPLGRRIAAKMAFERLCQKKSSSAVLDGIFDNVRNYIMHGKCNKIVSTMIYNKRIMDQNVFRFPMHHTIILTHDIKNHRCVGIVSIFGLYYYLVLLSDYLIINAPWDDCIVVHPQTDKAYEPLLRGANINIPDEAWIMDESKIELAGKFAHEKFMHTLKYKAIIIKPNS